MLNLACLAFIFLCFLCCGISVENTTRSRETDTVKGVNDTDVFYELDWTKDVIILYPPKELTAKMGETKTVPVITAVSCPSSDVKYTIAIDTYFQEVAYFPSNQQTMFYISCEISDSLQYVSSHIYHGLTSAMYFVHTGANAVTLSKDSETLIPEVSDNQNISYAVSKGESDNPRYYTPILWTKTDVGVVELFKPRPGQVDLSSSEDWIITDLLMHGMALSHHPRLIYLIHLTVTTDLLGRTWITFTPNKVSSFDERDSNVKDNIRHGTRRFEGSSAITSGNDSDHIHVNSTGSDMVYEIPVVVFRKMRPIDSIFRIVLYVLVGLSSVGMGCKTDLQVVKEVLKKPVAPIMGFIAQYICMPLIAFTISQVVTFDNPAVRLGIFTCGVCPGGGASNIFSYLLHGDISLSVTMTCISSLSALAMIPLWMFTLGQRFNDEKISIEVPFLKIVQTLVIVVTPLLVGFLFNIKFPTIAAKFKKVIKPLAIITILFILTVGVYSNLYMFRLFRGGTVAAACLLPYIGYLVGGILALISCQHWPRIKTVAIETGIQNTSVAYLMLTFSLPAPDSDLAAVGSAASALMTPLPLVVLSIFYAIYYKYKKKNESKQEKDKEMESHPDNQEALPMTKSEDRETEDKL